MLATLLLLLFYFIYLVNFGGFNPTYVNLTASDLLAFLSLSLALIALYIPKKVNPPLAIIIPLIGSTAIDFYLSLDAPIGFFLLLYAVVPFIATGMEPLVGIGIFMAFLYVIASLDFLDLWIPFLLLIPLAVVYWSAVSEIPRQRDIDKTNLTAATLLLLIPFFIAALSTNSVLGSLLYFSAVSLLFAGIIMLSRWRDTSWPFVASGLITYFSPIILYLLKVVNPSYAGVSNAFYLFFYGSLALVFYLPFLFDDKSWAGVLLFTPVLLGITAAFLSYFKTTYYFIAIDPWLVVAVALPKSPILGDLFTSVNFSWTPPQQPTQTQQGVRFIITGLPTGTSASITVGNVTCSGNSVIDCNDYGNWKAFPVKVGQYIYYPNPDSGYATPGDVIVVDYVSAQPAQPPTYTPSRPLRKVNPTSFDPDALLNRRLGVYKVKSLVGSGGFGYVYLGEMGGDYYAIKVLKVDKGDPMAYFQELFHEANNLVDLSNHPNVVKIYAVNVDLNVIKRALSGDFKPYYADPPRIVMEYMEGGSLDKYLNDDTFFYSLNWERTVKKAVRQVAEALAHIHGKGYIHSDVKPQNVFLTKKPKDPSELPTVDFKLGDLGSATRFGKEVSQVTVEYYPPEVFMSKASPSMDVFALGMTLYVLLTRKIDRPDLQVMNEAFDCYVNNDVSCVSKKVDEAKRLLASWDPQVQEPYRSLIKAMIDPNPANRPTALEVAKRLK